MQGMQEACDLGDAAICGIMAAIFVGAYYFASRKTFESMDINEPLSRSERHMVWGIIAMTQFLLFAVLMKR
jgi:hypothetical protein